MAKLKSYLDKLSKVLDPSLDSNVNSEQELRKLVYNALMELLRKIVRKKIKLSPYFLKELPIGVIKTPWFGWIRYKLDYVRLKQIEPFHQLKLLRSVCTKIHLYLNPAEKSDYLIEMLKKRICERFWDLLLSDDNVENILYPSLRTSKKQLNLPGLINVAPAKSLADIFESIRLLKIPRDYWYNSRLTIEYYQRLKMQKRENMCLENMCLEETYSIGIFNIPIVLIIISYDYATRTSTKKSIIKKYYEDQKYDEFPNLRED